MLQRIFGSHSTCIRSRFWRVCLTESIMAYGKVYLFLKPPWPTLLPWRWCKMRITCVCLSLSWKSFCSIELGLTRYSKQNSLRYFNFSLLGWLSPDNHKSQSSKPMPVSWRAYPPHRSRYVFLINAQLSILFISQSWFSLTWPIFMRCDLRPKLILSP